MPQLDFFILYKLTVTIYLTFTLFYTLIAIMFFPFIYGFLVWNNWYLNQFKFTFYSSKLIINLYDFNYWIYIKNYFN